MKSLRKIYDNLKPVFAPGGRLERWKEIFEVIENFFYSSGRRTFGSVHVRDASDVQRVMVTVMVATLPAVFYGMYNIGFQALSVVTNLGGEFTNDWHFIFINMLCDYNPESFKDCFCLI